jgi:hypothetical protein
MGKIMKAHQASCNKTDRKTRRKDFHQNPLLQNLLLRVNASKLKVIPLSLMLGLSATAIPAQAGIGPLPCPVSNFSITSGGIYTNSVTCNINSGGTLNNNVGGTLNNFGMLNNFGTLNNSGWFVNNSMLNNNSGGTLNIINLGGLSNFGSLNNNSGGTLNINNSGLINNSGASLTNSGTLVNNGGLRNSGSLINSGTLTNNNGLLANYSGGTLTSSGTLTNLTNAGTVTNAGTLSSSGTLSNAGTLTNTSTLTNSGAFNNDGTVNGAGTFNQTAGMTNINGTSFTQNQVNINGGNLFGFGSINGTVANNGGIIQGGASGKAGQLTINGGFTQGSKGTMQELFTQNAGYSTLQVNGTVNLGGTLDILTGGGLSFAAGQTYTIMDFAPGSLTGQFTHIDEGSFVGNSGSVNIGSGLVIDATYNNNLGNIQLRVAAVPEPETYGMMLTGLGLMGFMVRRKKSV